MAVFVRRAAAAANLRTSRGKGAIDNEVVQLRSLVKVDVLTPL
jgi:hypothetical protein